MNETYLNNIIFAKIETNSIEDAYQLFNSINNRGLKLTNGDILKTINLRIINKERSYSEVISYAQK
ncbi:UNVERIFIED_CONTAM: hypothetical protein O8I53_13525 [Campylobacter lari]